MVRAIDVASIPDDKVQEVRDRVDIIDLVGRYVELRRAGRNFKGLCPFHQERTPSFNVNPERKGYKCFGCGAGGDAIRFVMEVEGKSFPEAVRKIAELYGVTLPAAPNDRWGGGGGRGHEKDQAYAICRRATELYEELLHQSDQGQTARDYLQTRELSDEVVRTFRLGYAPAPSEGGWDTLVRALHADDLPLAQTLGLVGRSERTGNPYDKFRGRLMFPIIAPGGEPVAFSGRIIAPHDADEGERGPPPKYVNSSESLLYSKGKTLFGLAAARPAIRASKRAILVEGNVDVVKLHQWGHAETVAPLGTALTPDQARLVARFAEQAIMCFDGDNAGKKAAWAALPLLLEADLDVRMVLMPQGEDPDSVGAPRFAALLASAKPALEEMMIRIAARAGAAADARARGLDRVVPLMARVKRDTARDLYADRAAELFDVPAPRVHAAMRAARQQIGDAPGGDRRSAPRPPQENSRAVLSTSRGPVTGFAAERAPAEGQAPDAALPLGQAELTMLLVDLPHLASVAERTDALRWVDDARLRPIVEAVVDGAKRGENPSMSDLLERVDPAAQRRVYGAVFAGRYRTQQSDTAQSFDPQHLLATLVARCRIEALEHRIVQIDSEISQAQVQGFPDKARELSMLKLQLRREQDDLRQQPTGGAATAASSEAPSQP